MPDACRTIRSSAGFVKKQARIIAKMADDGNKSDVPGCAGGGGGGMCSAGMGWCLYSERHGKQITL